MTDELPWIDEIVSTGSGNPLAYKTLVLLRLYEKNGSPVYFIVEGVGHLDHEDPLDDEYFYDEHSCPTNYVPVEAIFTPDSTDPHGVFEYVRTVWYPPAYDKAKACGMDHEFLRELFPETIGGITIDGSYGQPALTPAKPASG